jgi:hypothetical protein
MLRRKVALQSDEHEAEMLTAFKERQTLEARITTLNQQVADMAASAKQTKNTTGFAPLHRARARADRYKAKYDAIMDWAENTGMPFWNMFQAQAISTEHALNEVRAANAEWRTAYDRVAGDLVVAENSIRELRHHRDEYIGMLAQVGTQLGHAKGEAQTQSQLNQELEAQVERFDDQISQLQNDKASLQHSLELSRLEAFHLRNELNTTQNMKQWAGEHRREASESSSGPSSGSDNDTAETSVESDDEQGVSMKSQTTDGSSALTVDSAIVGLSSNGNVFEFGSEQTTAQAFDFNYPAKDIVGNNPFGSAKQPAVTAQDDTVMPVDPAIISASANGHVFEFGQESVHDTSTGSFNFAFATHDAEVSNPFAQAYLPTQSASYILFGDTDTGMASFDAASSSTNGKTAINTESSLPLTRCQQRRVALKKKRAAEAATELAEQQAAGQYHATASTLSHAVEKL